ncbi:MAG: 2-hydroxyacyl-CoA dehydratase, partial [Deltaproteobacteria bacterium]|nr:2-hydroxyacyl-CoA dehydratase [Deltaproteobacteria bacterium]
MSGASGAAARAGNGPGAGGGGTGPSQAPLTREQRVLARASDRRLAERKAELDRLTSRDDFMPELEYFVRLHEGGQGLEAVGERTGNRPCAVLCLQAPVELFWAHGFSPVKIYSGSYASANLTSPGLPALMCPLVKAVLGEMELDPGLASVPWVVPLTCDWVVKFREARGLFGDMTGPVHMLEVPRVKEGPRARARWLSEIRELSAFLKASGGKPLRRGELAAAIRRMEGARRAVAGLVALRRRGLVPAVWHSFIAGTFFLDAPERWTQAAEKAAEAFGRRDARSGPGQGPGREVGREPRRGRDQDREPEPGRGQEPQAGRELEPGLGRGAGPDVLVSRGRESSAGPGPEPTGGTGRAVTVDGSGEASVDGGLGGRMPGPTDFHVAPAGGGQEGAGQEAGKGAGQEAGKGAGQEAGKGAGKEAGKGAGKEAGKGAGQEAGKGAGQEAGKGAGKEAGGRPDGVFLTGAPVFFPNFKVLHLMEEAGLRCLGDDMCSSERLFPRHVEISDTSADGMLEALAEAYHRGCLCPVFAESERRAALIREAADGGEVRGVVFHLL